MLSDQFWTILEYTGVFSTLLYLWLEIKQKPAMWIIGIISSLIYIFVFAYARIYADMGFNIYYAGMSVFGYIMWRKNKNKSGEEAGGIDYIHLDKNRLIGITTIGIIIYGAIFFLLSRYTDSPVPQIDAFTTTLSIVATWMLAKKIVEHWAFWIIVNLVSIYLYYIRGLYPTMGLYMIYTFISFYGYYNWLDKGSLIKNKA